MSGEVDYYDVQGMIRDARSEIRGEIANAVDAASQALRAELDDAVRELREAAGAERVDRQDAIEGLQRVLESRTGHLA